jgi:hypothetical protein
MTMLQVIIGIAFCPDSLVLVDLGDGAADTDAGAALSVESQQQPITTRSNGLEERRKAGDVDSQREREQAMGEGSCDNEEGQREQVTRLVASCRLLFGRQSTSKARWVGAAGANRSGDVWRGSFY